MATLFLDFNRKYVNGTNAAIYELLNYIMINFIFSVQSCSQQHFKQRFKRIYQRKKYFISGYNRVYFFFKLIKPFDRQSIKDNSKSFVHRFELSYYNKKIFEDCEKFLKILMVKNCFYVAN